MPDANQIRINELARELEVKARAILDYLPEAGVTEKKTHSSSIDVAAAEKVTKHFKQLAQAEADAEAAAASEKIAKDAAAKAARRSPAAAAPTAAPAKPAPVVAPVAAVAASLVAPHPAPPVVEAKPPAAVAAKPVATPVAPAAPSAPAAKAPAAAPPRATLAPRPAATTPRAPLSTGPKPPVPGPTTNRPPITHQPSGPVRGMPLHTQRLGQGRPGAPASMRSGQSAGQPGRAVPGRPIAQRPGAPGSVPGRYPSGPGGASPVGKAEPGKPIYERKPASRARPTMDRRFEEGERKLHPVRARPGVGGTRAARPEAPPPVERPRREITITEGVTVRELAEKLDVRAKDLLKVLLDKGVFASINQALDTPTAATLAEAFNGVVSV